MYSLQASYSISYFTFAFPTENTCTVEPNRNSDSVQGSRKAFGRLLLFIYSRQFEISRHKKQPAYSSSFWIRIRVI